MSLLDDVTVRPCGETAVVLELGAAIDPVLHDAVLRLDASARAAVEDGRLPGVEELVPSYRSLLVRIDPLRTTPEQTIERFAQLEAVPGGEDTRRHEVPVSFAAEDAEDLAEVARTLGCSPSHVVAELCRTDLRLYLHGFAPGFAYLGGVPEGLRLPRRATPRAPVRAGAVLLAAGQAALCPTPMPTGWWVVGHTDVELFQAQTEPHVPFAAGDTVRFVARSQ